MKKLTLIVLSMIGLALMSCDNPMKFVTKVNEDGSLEKTIVLLKTDSNRAADNLFGISEKKGWNVVLHKVDSGGKEDKPKFEITFQKHFQNAEVANLELDSQGDTLFHVHAQFEKRFRWFFTYLRYTETFRPINRFTLVDPAEFFNQEDNAFIDRLPAEGKSISKADSLYLQLLNTKISDHFARMGIFRENYEILKEVVKRKGFGKAWLDTLQNRQEYIYNHIEKMQGDPFFASKMADSLHIPLKPGADKDFDMLSRSLNQRISFMSFARDGNYTNIMDMPWDVVASNADSISGNTLFWHPLMNKFVHKDYVMFAESRKLNIWPVAVSSLLLAATAYLLFMRRK